MSRLDFLYNHARTHGEGIIPSPLFSTLNWSLPSKYGRQSVSACIRAMSNLIWEDGLTELLCLD